MLRDKMLKILLQQYRHDSALPMSAEMSVHGGRSRHTRYMLEMT
jgi:hypothetical protein